MTAPADLRVARRATGLLRLFNEAGALDVADVHVAGRLGVLGGERDDAVLLAAGLAVRALRLGSVCVDLPTVAGTTTAEGDEAVDLSGLPWPDAAGWPAACGSSPLVAVGPGAASGRPLRLVGGRLYLDRYWRQEESVRLDLRRREAAPPPVVDLPRLRAGLARLFPGPPPDAQRLAAAASALRWVTVLAGGPGTGKTTTIARLLALLHDQPGPRPRVALAAPTGKAAARLEEAVREQTARLPPDDRERLGDLHASTVHRLLGWRPDSRSRFRHDRANRLPHDLVVVDETSMVSLTLMARLLEAVRPAARLVLVGDPDQLASVEAGAVLGDLVRASGQAPRADEQVEALRQVAGGDLPERHDAGPVGNGVVVLRRTWRFGGAIAHLAAAVQAGDADRALALLAAGTADVTFVAVDGDARGVDTAGLRADVLASARSLAEAAEAGDAQAAVRRLDGHRLLCAHREGPWGVRAWGRQVETWLAADGLVPRDAGDAYAGRPLLVTANDYETGLFNGDTGVLVRAGTGLRAAFARGGAAVLVPPARLSSVQTVHAMTVHRGQGSQFDRVTLLLPPETSPLLTRELLYTAVTRARRHVRVLGSEAAVRAAVERPVARASGLRDRLHAEGDRLHAEGDRSPVSPPTP